MQNHVTGKVDFRHAQFKRGFHVGLTKIDEGLSMEHARVAGDADFRSVAVGAEGASDDDVDSLANAALNLKGITVGGDLMIDSAYGYATVHKEELRCRGCIAGRLDLSLARVTGSVTVSGVDVLGDLRLWGAQAFSFFARASDNSANMPTHIDGSVSLDGVDVSGHIEFEGVRIGGQVQAIAPRRMGGLFLRTAAIEAPGREPAWRLEPCHVAGKVVIAGLHTKGSIDMSGLQCGSRCPDRPAPVGTGGVEFDNCRIDGSVFFCRAGHYDRLGAEHAASFGSVPLPPRADVGSVKLSNCRVLGELNLSHAVFGGRDGQSGIVNLGGLQVGRLVCSRRPLAHCESEEAWRRRSCASRCVTLMLDHLTCEANVDLTGLRCHQGGNSDAPSVRARFADLKGDLSLSGAQLKALDLNSSSIAGDVNLSDASAGSVGMVGANVHGRLDLSGIRVGDGQVSCSDGEFGELLVASTQANSAEIRGTLDLSGSTFGGLEIGCSAAALDGCAEPAAIRIGSIDGGGVVVRGGATVTGVVVGRGGVQATPAIDLTNSEIQGDLSFAPEGGDVVSRVQGDLAISGSKINGNLVLGNVRIDHGDIELADAEIEQNLRCSSDSGAAVICESLRMRSLKCAGDVDLAALTVRPSRTAAESTAASDWKRPSLDITGAEIAGALLLCDDHTEGKRVARLCGGFLSNGANIGRLRITGASFTDAVSPPSAVTAEEVWHELGRVRRRTAVYLATLVVVAAGLGFRYMPAWSSAQQWQIAKWAILLLAVLFVCAKFVQTLRWNHIHTRSWWARTLGLKHVDRGIRVTPSLVRSIQLPAMRCIGIERLRSLAGLASARVLLSFGLLIATLARFAVDSGQGDVAFGWIGLAVVAGFLSHKYLQAWQALSHSVDVAQSVAGDTRARDERRRSSDSGARPGLLMRIGRAGRRLISRVYTTVATALMLDLLLVYFGLILVVQPTVTAFAVWGLVLLLSGFLWLVLWHRLGDDTGVDQPDDCHDATAFGTVPALGDSLRRSLLALNLRSLAFKDLVQAVSWNRIIVGGPKSQHADVSFERAQIDHLQIVEPIPNLIDLSNLRVHRWSLGNKDPEYRYLELLDHSSEHNSAIYSKMEQDLRNQGKRFLAETVHRAMRRQEQWRETRGLQTAMMLAHSVIGYGTQRVRVLKVMLAWFAFSALWIAMDYESVLTLSPDAELAIIEAEGGQPEQGEALRRTLSPTADKSIVERLGHGFAVAMRFHLPILNWDIWPYLIPTGPVMWVYTGVVAIVHWVLWPLLLASLIPALIPRPES